MSFDAVRRRTGKELLAIGLLSAFGIAMLPPVLWVVNESTLIGGYPLLYLWAIWWGVFGTAALYWTTSNDLFGIADDQVPPELAEGGSLVTGGKTANDADTVRGDD